MKEHRFARPLGGLAVGIALAFAVAPSVAAQEAPADEATLGETIAATVAEQTADLPTTIQERVDALLAQSEEFQGGVTVAPEESGNTVMTEGAGTETTSAAPAESAAPVTTEAPAMAPAEGSETTTPVY